ncbi:hypothetical protein F5876DRAFT_84623 [Lentinula aff. lateritia]|uniref:Uncharacterized protein n=1 Tax=Lentinula aff. lateritia TaxID=2804960 RepID=A0ACC1TG29_9AGAR|nr:hypothetical protein F5876DRAFT_84623 [Lentinula aff. lateritia]
MCLSIGVEPFTSPRRGGWWGEVLLIGIGIGIWNSGYRSSNVCVSTRERNGGMTEVAICSPSSSPSPFPSSSPTSSPTSSPPPPPSSNSSSQIISPSILRSVHARYTTQPLRPHLLQWAELQRPPERPERTRWRPGSYSGFR